MAEDQRPPLPWGEVRASRSGLALPFVWLEWVTEWLVFRLKRWALVDLLQILASFSILVAGISYLLSADERREAAETQRKTKHYQAWQVINLAQGKGGSGGRIDALRDLVKDGESLDGADLSHAWLSNADLSGASLQGARLDSANLQAANLTDVDLSGASLVGADLTGVTFRRTNLWGADLRGAMLGEVIVDSANFTLVDFRDAELSPGMNLLLAESLAGANIYRVRAEPEFVSWAVDSMKAVSAESDSAWERLRTGSRRLNPSVLRKELGDSLSSVCPSSVWMSGRGAPVLREAFVVWRNLPNGNVEQVASIPAQLVRERRWDVIREQLREVCPG